MDESLPLPGRSRAVPIGLAIYYWTRLPYRPIAGVTAVEVADEPTIHGIGWPVMMAQGTFIARSQLAPADRPLFRPPPVRSVYLNSRGQL